GNASNTTQQHLVSLMNMKPVKSSHPKELRKFYDALILHTRALESLKIDRSQYVLPLLPILLKALPSEIVLDFERSKSKLGRDSSSFISSTVDNVSTDYVSEFESLLIFLKVEIETREKFALNREWNDPKQVISDKKFSQYFGRRQASATALRSVSSQERTPVDKCIFCESYDHKSSACKKHMTNQQRVSLVKKSKRWFCCLGKNDLSRNCKFKNRIKCSKCQAHHLTVMHTNDEVSEPVNSTDAAVAESSN